MSRRLVFPAVLAALLCGALASCKDPPPPPPPPQQPLPKAEDVDVAATVAERRCESDAECVLTTLDCCGCNALGRQTGVRKDRLAALIDRRLAICGAVACAQAVSDDPSCLAKRAVCRSGVCVPDTTAGAPQGVGVGKIPD